MVNTDRLIEIFDDAQSRKPGAEREAFLDASCARDQELKAQIVSLLDSHEGAGDFLMQAALPGAAFISEQPGDVIGRYRLLEKLGEGGCGVVYVADQTAPVRRRVALKVIKLGMDTRQVIARFEAERQALAMMDHPNIAKVLDAGSTDSGRPFFVMELVRGAALTEYCDENSLSTNERLELFIKICSAIQHAHQKGIIHRDIKPSNILVTLHDGVPVPRVIDFGIAKAIEGKLTHGTVYTQLLQFVGTPAYMSPEQAELSGLDVDTRSDLYSLGVVLYELLTGEPPFNAQKLVASGLDAMRKTIREIEPTRPSTKLRQTLAGESSRRSKLNPNACPDSRSRIHNDLDWIIMKCLEKDRSRRYETVNALANDLLRHLRNEPVTARPPSFTYKAHKAFDRNRLAWSAAIAVALALFAGIGISSWQATEARRARKEAEAGKLEAQHQLYVASMFSIGQAWAENNYRLVQQLLEDTRTSPHRGFEWRHWHRQAHQHLKALYGHTEMIKGIAFLGNDQRLVTVSVDKTARIWNTESGKQIHELVGHEAAVNAVAVSRDAKRIATGSSDHSIILWDPATAAVMSKSTPGVGPVNCLALSADGTRIMVGGDASTGVILDLATLQVIVRLEGHADGIISAAFSPDGSKVATASLDGTALVWRASDGAKLFPLTGHTREITVVAFSPDGQRIATGSVDQTVQFWDPGTGAKLPFPLLGGEPIVTVAFSGDGRRIVTGSKNSTARLWNATNGEPEALIRGHVRGLQSVAISLDGKRVATGGFDRAVKVWDADVTASALLRVKGNPTNSVLAVAISPNCQRVATGSGTFSNDGTTLGSGEEALQIWDLNTKQNLLKISGHTAGISSIAFSPSGHQLLSGSGDHTAKLWDVENGEPLLALKGHASSVSSVAFFPNGQRVVTGSHDQTARVWNLATGLPLLVLAEHEGPVTSVAVSPDGRWIATGSFDESARVWDSASGQLVQTIKTASSRIYCVAFSPDSRLLAVGGWDPPTIWRLGIEEQNPITLQCAIVSSIAFSSDGLRIITSSLGGIARMHETSSGRELLTIRAHEKHIYGVTLSNDGHILMAGRADQTVGIWLAATTNQMAAWDAEKEAAPKILRNRAINVVITAGK